MKIKFLFTAICIATFIYNANATVHTVSNNAYSPGQFTNLQNAIDSANAGDTIYVEPSPFDYGSVNISKLLYLFGGGGWPYTYQLNNPTTLTGAVNYSNQTSFPTSSPSGSVIQGFNLLQVNIGSNLSNITVIRNAFTYNVAITGTDTNIVIANNTFADYNGQSVYFSDNNGANDVTALVANNFFYNGSIDAPSYQETGIIIQNNIFYGYSSTSSNSDQYFNTNIGVTVRNNIFYCVGGANTTFASGCTSCTFLNNLTYSPNTTQTLPDAGNNGLGNIDNTNPQFINAPAPYTFIQQYNDTLYKFNWALSPSSPGHNAGTDGTDIGIYGGAYPMPNFEMITKLPQVRLLNINNASVAPNGTLNVNVIATKRN